MTDGVEMVEVGWGRVVIYLNKTKYRYCDFELSSLTHGRSPNIKNSFFFDRFCCCVVDSLLVFVRGGGTERGKSQGDRGGVGFSRCCDLMYTGTFLTCLFIRFTGSLTPKRVTFQRRRKECGKSV